MAWYFYTGSVVRPIPIKLGMSKSVRPNSKVEILELTIDAQALIRRGQLRLTAKPKVVPPASTESVSVVKLVDVLKTSLMAETFAEKGKSPDAGTPPVSAFGAEMTAAERGVEVETTVSQLSFDDENDDEVVGEVDQVEDMGENGRVRRSRKRR